jgi:hypothetical protein
MFMAKKKMMAAAEQCMDGQRRAGKKTVKKSRKRKVAVK